MNSFRILTILKKIFFTATICVSGILLALEIEEEAVVFESSPEIGIKAVFITTKHYKEVPITFEMKIYNENSTQDYDVFLTDDAVRMFSVFVTAADGSMLSEQDPRGGRGPHDYPDIVPQRLPSSGSISVVIDMSDFVDFAKLEEGDLINVMIVSYIPFAPVGGAREVGSRIRIGYRINDIKVRSVE